MDIVELILDEMNEEGVEAISVVESPAIEENFVALKSHEVKFKAVDEDKKILIGPVLIPNKPIYRKTGEQEYYIYFTRETVLKASQLYLKNGNQSNATLEHAKKVSGVTLVESWIVEDKEKDKSAHYGMDVPLGTWMGTMKIDNEVIWQDYVKTGMVKGFSIEGFFAPKEERPNETIRHDFYKDEVAQNTLSKISNMIQNHKKEKQLQLASFSDYPSGVKNNAKRVLEYVEKNGWGTCGTGVGKARANQLAKGKPISLETIKRMRSYLIRHAKDLQASKSYSDGCGKLMYDSWGGKAGLRWATSKLKQLDQLEYIDPNVDVYKLDEPCWEGYKQIGFKMKNGKKVPNCVPK